MLWKSCYKVGVLLLVLIKLRVNVRGRGMERWVIYARKLAAFCLIQMKLWDIAVWCNFSCTREPVFAWWNAYSGDCFSFVCVTEYRVSRRDAYKCLNLFKEALNNINLFKEKALSGYTSLGKACCPFILMVEDSVNYSVYFHN